MDVLLDEVESLEAILMDDVKICRNTETGIPELIETTVLPTVGENTDRQYVCITLQVIPTNGYPDVQPRFYLRNPRGLDDHSIDAITVAVQRKLTEAIGMPVVFDLIEVIRERLTESNLPSGQCVVCLYGFAEGDEFTKTVCYHYLHSYCLARHLNASQRNYQEEQDKLPAWQRQLAKPFQPCCPVCREQIENDIEPISQSKAPLELKNAPRFEVTNELKVLQTKMTHLFLHQKKRGGIIDVDADDMNVISIGPEEQPAEELQKENGAAATSTDELLRNGAAKPVGTQRQFSSRNHREKTIKVAVVATASQPPAKTVVVADNDDDDGGGGGPDERHRRHHHDHHHGRRGGNRHNRRRQYHNNTSSSSAASVSAESNSGQQSQATHLR